VGVGDPHAGHGNAADVYRRPAPSTRSELAHLDIGAELLDVVNGVDVAPLVEAELNGCGPERSKMCLTDAAAIARRGTSWAGAAPRRSSGPEPPRVDARST
jgi:hypothetical protein